MVQKSVRGKRLSVLAQGVRMRNSILSVLLVFSAALSVAQEDPSMMMPPPPELNQLWFLLGDFEGPIKMSMNPGAPPLETQAKVKAVKTLGGMWLELFHSFDMEGTEMTGRMLLTYEPSKKKYVSYWFDSAAPGAMTMTGSVKGQTLIMISDPVEMPGMPGKVTFRATWSMKSATDVKFVLEMKTAGKWGVFIESVYSRK